MTSKAAMVKGKNMVKKWDFSCWRRNGSGGDLGEKTTNINTDPDDFADPHFAVFSACEEWKALGLNSLADADDFSQITKQINGGLNVLPSRLVYYAKVKRAYGVGGRSVITFLLKL